MSRQRIGGDLPEPVRRYFSEVAQMQPPNDLLDAALTEIQGPPAPHRFSLLAVFGFAAAAVAGILALAVLVPGLQQVAGPTTSQQPSPSAQSPTTSQQPSPSAQSPTMRLFDSDDIRSLVPQEGDFDGADYTFGSGACPGGVGSTAGDGLDGRGSVGMLRDDSTGDYPLIFGSWVSVWADAATARAALAAECPWSQQPVIEPIEVPAGGLGDGGRCAVIDWGTLADRGWCQFAVSNATFEMYIRTNTNGTELHPDAAADLALLAVTLKERAEDLAAGP